MSRKLILLSLCSLQTESCWRCSGTVIARGCIILLSLSMISPDLWVIITKKGVWSLSNKDQPSWQAMAPRNFQQGIKEKKMSFTIKLIHHCIKGPGRGYPCTWRNSELDWTRLWAAFSDITAPTFEADLSTSWTKRSAEPPPANPI